MVVSIVSPVYNSAPIIATLVKRIESVCKSESFDYEILLVDDRSNDSSWEKILETCKFNSKVKGFRLSKNFGQHAAITAGITMARGDYIIIMDCDLQDNPIYIPQLIAKANEGYNVVYTIKDIKKHSFFRNISSKLFFILVDTLSDVKLDKNIGTMTLIGHEVAKEFIKIKDYHRHTSLVFQWLGYKRGFINVKQDERYVGKSSYNFGKLFIHALNGIISQSQRLLNLSIIIGLLVVILCLVAVVGMVVLSTILEFDKGWPSLIITMFFTTGLIMFVLGIQAIYIGKVFEQVKQRPIFIIDEKVNFESNDKVE